MPYDGERSIRALLEGLRDRFGWDGVYEGDNIIALSDPKGLGNISLEPGGQFELSGAPLETVHETCEEVHEHLTQVREVADPLGIGFLGLGASPELDAGPKRRSCPRAATASWRPTWPRSARYGLDMMFRTCTVQVNLDFASEADMVKKLRVSLALQPVATALFANSPFLEGKPNGYLVLPLGDLARHRQRTAPACCPSSSRTASASSAMSTTRSTCRCTSSCRDGRYIDAAGESFRDFLRASCRSCRARSRVMKDWADHLTTIFPEVRLKKYLEMRGADAGPWRRLCALPAFWVGLLYDQAALDAAWDLVKDWTAEERQALRDAVPTQALHAKIRGRSVQDIAQDVLALSRAGLEARGQQGCKGKHRGGLPRRAGRDGRHGPHRGGESSRALHGSWGGNIDRVFRDFAY